MTTNDASNYPDFFRKIVQVIPNPVFIKNEQRKFILVNDAFCEVFGIDEKKILGKTDDHFFPLEECKVFWAIDRRVLTEGISVENEETITLPNGKMITALTRKSLLESGGEKFILGIITDITEKTQMMEKIRESEIKFKTIFELAPDPKAFFCLNDKAVKDVNDAFLKVSNMTREAILGTPGTMAFTFDDEINRRVYFKRLYKDRKVDNMEISLRLNDGRVIPYLVSSRMIKLHNLDFVLYSLREITEIKAAQKAIKEREATYKNLIDTLPNLLLIHQKGRVLFANKAILETLGKKFEIVQGMNVAELFIDPQAKNKNGSQLKKFLQTDNGSIEIQISPGDDPPGVKTFMLLNRKIIYEGTMAILSILIDITERKDIEKYILGKVIEAEEKERRRFAADIHDDIGPLISTARLLLGFLEKTTGPRQFVKNSEKIYDILDEMDSKIHFIIQNVVPHELNLNGLEAAIRDLCKTFEQNRNVTIELTSNLNNFRFAKEIELHFYRIITELLNNSMKHSGATKIFLKLNRTTKMFRVWYFDNGKGYDFNKIPDKTSGIGISNIMYRADLINGDLNFEKKAGKVIVKIRKRFD
jgi:PAS domain S-box-containing protein